MLHIPLHLKTFSEKTDKKLLESAKVCKKVSCHSNSTAVVAKGRLAQLHNSHIHAGRDVRLLASGPSFLNRVSLSRESDANNNLNTRQASISMVSTVMITD